MGWEAKQKGARCRPCQAEKDGSGYQDWRVLSVSSDWGRRSGQRLGGKEMWTADITEIDKVLFGGSNRVSPGESNGCGEGRIRM